MNRYDPTIKVAIKILGKDAREDIRETIEGLAHVFELSLRRSKRGKAAARRLGQALRRLDAALRDKDLYYGLQGHHQLFEHESLRRWIDSCDVTANRPLDPSDPNSDGQDWSSAYEKKAAEYALGLMHKYNKPISTTKAASSRSWLRLWLQPETPTFTTIVARRFKARKQDRD